MTAVLLTLKVASVATLLVLGPGIALAYLLARKQFPGRDLLATLTGLPLVLPPTAVGYLLLGVLSVDSPLGGWLRDLGVEVLLTWRAAVLAASVMALPLVVQTARVAFESVDPRLEEVARTLGHPPHRVWLQTTLPLAWPGLVAAAILGFTRAVGEFGATVMIAGNIPGETQTLASAIFTAQTSGTQTQALGLIALAVAVGVVALLASERLRSRRP